MNKPATLYITHAGLGKLNGPDRTTAMISARAIQYGDFKVPLWTEAPPCNDASAALLLAAIDLLRKSRNEQAQQWVTETRKFLRVSGSAPKEGP